MQSTFTLTVQYMHELKDMCANHVQVCSVLLKQHSPSCQILCCKAINLLVTHILQPSAVMDTRVLEAHMGQASASLLASPIQWADRSLMEMRLQNLATSALAKLPT